MASYTLSCCSTVDLSEEWLERRDIRHVCFNYKLSDTWYKDDFGVSVEPRELYRRMLAGEPATTSQVGTGDYRDFFAHELEQGRDVLHVTLSSGISSTYNSACLAARMLQQDYPDRTIRVVDSLGASAGYGLLLDRMADLRDEGMGIDELAQWAETHRLEANHLFLSSDLTFFVRGGRISKAAGLVGSVLQICPLMHVATDGTLQVKEKIRTKTRSKNRMLERMRELAEGGENYARRVFISHADCEDDARDVARMVEKAFPKLADGMVHIFPIGATIGCHTGPGTVALFFWGNPARW